jgi:hypothetical protein
MAADSTSAIQRMVVVRNNPCKLDFFQITSIEYSDSIPSPIHTQSAERPTASHAPIAMIPDISGVCNI